MGMSEKCRYDREAGTYLTPDGEECDVPKREHCTARKTCSNHPGWGEITCPTCINRVRHNIRRIAEVGPLLPALALEVGRIESDAVALAGPQGDPLVTSWRRINTARATGKLLGELDGPDENDPTNVLGTWQAMISEDYGHDLPDRITLSTAVAYLERHLHRIANDEEQDFRLLASEVRACRDRLEAALRVRPFVQRGERCPTCTEKPPHLRRVYSHWCEEPTCDKVHLADDSLDLWVCPANREHWWTHEDYTNRIEKRATPNRCA